MIFWRLHLFSIASAQQLYPHLTLGTGSFVSHGTFIMALLDADDEKQAKQPHGKRCLRSHLGS